MTFKVRMSSVPRRTPIALSPCKAVRAGGASWISDACGYHHLPQSSTITRKWKEKALEVLSWPPATETSTTHSAQARLQTTAHKTGPTLGGRRFARPRATEDPVPSSKGRSTAGRRAGLTPPPGLWTPPQIPRRTSSPSHPPTRLRSLPRNSGDRAAALHPASNSWRSRAGAGRAGPRRGKGWKGRQKEAPVPRRVLRLRAAGAGGLRPHVGWQRSPAPSRRRRPRKPRAQGAVRRGPAGRLGPVRVPKPGAHLRLMLVCPLAPASPGRPWPRPCSGSTALQPRSPSAPAAASGVGNSSRQLKQRRRRRRRRLGGHMGGRGLRPFRPDHRIPVSGVTDQIAPVGLTRGSQPQGRCGYLQAPTVLESYGYR